MHSIPYNSERQVIARFVARHTHNQSPPNTKPAQRRRKADRRDFRQEIALCIWGASALSHSVEL